MKIWVPKNDVMFLELCIKGKHEEWVSRSLKNILQDGMVAVDIGASFGYYTILASKLVGEKGKVFAFEPHSFTYGLLQRNIELNQLSNVIPIQKAVSNRAGTTKLWSASTLEGSNILTPRSKKEPIIVETTSLDEFFNDFHSSVDVLKMDIEGAETMALQGMRQFIAKNGNLKMIIEFHPHRILSSGQSTKEFWDELRRSKFWPPFLIETNGQLRKLSTPLEIENLGKGKSFHIFVEREV